jgi:glutamyl endopeptidase
MTTPSKSRSNRKKRAAGSAFDGDADLPGFDLDAPDGDVAVHPPPRTSECFMQQTNGGGSLERVEGFNEFRARNAGLAIFANPTLSAPRSDKDDGQIENIIGNADTRVAVGDTTALPWRCIAYLAITYANGRSSSGTAWFIGPQALATAGHNVFHRVNGRAISIKVWPAYNGASAPFGSQRVVRIYHSPAWPQQPVDANDFAVIVVDSPELGSRLGWFGLRDYAVTPREMLAQVCGYAADRPLRTQYYDGGRIATWRADTIEYPYDTAEGMSGAPVWIKSGDDRIAVGIHVSGYKETNVARRITGLVYDKLIAYSGIRL